MRGRAAVHVHSCRLHHSARSLPLPLPLPLILTLSLTLNPNPIPNPNPNPNSDPSPNDYTRRAAASSPPLLVRCTRSLYLADISPKSRLNLPYISPTSPLYLPGEMHVEGCNVFSCSFAAVECSGQATVRLRANRFVLLCGKSGAQHADRLQPGFYP